MSSDLAQLLHSYLGKENIFLDKEEFVFQTLSHPTYPSLHALTGVLDHFSVENLAIELPTSKEALNELPDRFLAHFETGREPGIYLTEKLTSNKYAISGPETNDQISAAELLEQWSGVTLIAENSASNQLSEGQKTDAAFTRNSVILSAITFMFLSFLLTGSILLILFFALSITGVGLSYLVLSHENGNANKFFDKICSSSSNPKSNCGEILNTKAATIYSDLKLGDLSFMYFTGLSLFSMFLFLAGLAPSIIPVISLCTIPVIIYSLYQQLIVIKKICRVCMFIVEVLILQACFGIYMFVQNPIVFHHPFVTMAIAITGFLSAILVWKLLKTTLINNKNHRKLTIDNLKFKRDTTVLFSLIDASEYRKEISINREITLGCKDDPVVELVIVTNPFCTFCKEVHDIVDKIHARSIEGLKITIRFNVSPEHAADDSYKISHRLLEIYHTQPESVFLKAMNEVYNTEDPSAWLKVNGLGAVGAYDQVLADYYNWCINNNANFTPIILINGKEFPKQYERKDLDFLISTIVEEEQERREISNLTCSIEENTSIQV